MSSESGRVRWYGQNFEGVAIPEGGGGVGEEARLGLAPVGVYEMIFRQQPRFEFSGALLFDGAEPRAAGDEGRRQFEAAEDISGIERTLMIRSAGGDVPFESLEIIPLDREERPIDFTPLEVGARQSTIRYKKTAPPESLKVRFSGINVFDVETVAAYLWAHGGQYSPGPLAAFIRRADEIRVDRLSNPTGEPRSLAGHLQALSGALPDRAAGRACSLECAWQYRPAPGGPAVSVPVLSVNPGDFPGDAAAGFAAISAALREWYLNLSPARGAFVFGVRVFGARGPEHGPALHLTQLSLPQESIADLGRGR